MTETTANQYLRYLKNIHGQDFKNIAWIKDTENVVNTINEKYSPGTRASALNAVAVACEVTSNYGKFAKFYKSKFQEAIKPINDRRNTGQKTEKEEAYWLTWEEVIKRRDELEGEEKVLLSLYTYIPPRRAMDYGTMEINSKTANSFDTETKKFVFRDYKTAGTYGEQEIPVPEELYTVLMDYLGDKKSGKLLTYSTPSITKRLNKIFKPKKISVSALRHIYDTHHFGKVKANMTDTARLMAHSVSQQQQYIKN